MLMVRCVVEDANNGEDFASLTPGSDRDYVLGVFMVGNGKGLQAAPVDIKTGKLLRDGAAVPLYDQTIGEVGTVRIGTHRTPENMGFPMYRSKHRSMWGSCCIEANTDQYGIRVV
jgi:hypothetical protein